MPRRASLPGADLLFGSPPSPRPAKDLTGPGPASSSPEPVPGTVVPEASPRPPVPPALPAPAPPPPVPVAGRAPEPEQDTSSAPESRPQPGPPRASGGQASRPRHEQKITFYCTDSDLTRLEAARLSLRAHHRLPSDRGRIVRAAIAEILDDFDARGTESSLVRRLSSE